MSPFSRRLHNSAGFVVDLWNTSFPCIGHVYSRVAIHVFGLSYFFRFSIFSFQSLKIHRHTVSGVFFGVFWSPRWRQVFIGHKHYIMMMKFNPIDSNTFASASLDRQGKHVGGTLSRKLWYTLSNWQTIVPFPVYYVPLPIEILFKALGYNLNMYPVFPG